MALPLLVFTVQFACAQVDRSSDVGDLFIGMPIRAIPNAGYIDLSCVDDASRKLRSWSESSECPLGMDQLRAVRFEFDPATSRDGTSVAGHPVILTALVDDSETLAGLKIDTDPEALGQFDRALGDAPREGVRHRGLILDLRETVGGGTVSGREQAYAFLSRLIERPFLGSRRSIPEYRPDSLGGWLSVPSDTIWPPVRRERIAYTGPVVVLISPRTRGAAEDFVAAFQAGGRGASIGESSAGSTGKTATLTLSSGWKLRVTVSRDAFPDGKEFVPTGIAPQFPVEVRVEDILAGRDAVLDRARAYLTDAARR